jgi:hypothetical protein
VHKGFGAVVMDDLDKGNYSVLKFLSVKPEVMTALVSGWIVKAGAVKDDKAHPAFCPCPVKGQHLFRHPAVLPVFSGVQGHDDSVF